MAKAEAVVAVDKHPFVMTANGHTGLSHINRPPDYCISGVIAK
jgi:hypothetical protein